MRPDDGALQLLSSRGFIPDGTQFDSDGNFVDADGILVAVTVHHYRDFLSELSSVRVLTDDATGLPRLIIPRASDGDLPTQALAKRLVREGFVDDAVPFTVHDGRGKLRVTASYNASTIASSNHSVMDILSARTIGFTIGARGEFFLFPNP